jgi:phosphohistidine phosphatase SixA
VIRGGLRAAGVALTVAAMLPRPAAAEAVAAEALAAGGHVVFLRHTEASEGSDLDVRDLVDCATQRNLSARGREDAAAIGRALRARGVLVGRALASPYCRTRETAALAFGAERTRLAEGLTSICETTPAAARARTAELKALLAAPPAPGVNTVLVSHNCNIRVLADASWPDCARRPGMGDAVVFRPDGGGGYRLVGCVALAEFRAWAEPPAKP